MSQRLLTPAVLLVALLAPSAWSATPAPYAPTLAASAAVQGVGAVVSWAPGVELADFYRVYGISESGAKTLLAPQATELAAEVPAGYATYAVSGVRLNVESDPIPAVAGKCLIVSTDPPGAGLWDCTP